MSARIIILPTVRIERADSARRATPRPPARSRPRLVAFNPQAEPASRRRQSPAQLARFIRHLFEAERS